MVNGAVASLTMQDVHPASQNLATCELHCAPKNSSGAICELNRGTLCSRPLSFVDLSRTKSLSSSVGVNELSCGPSESVSQSQTAWSVQAEEQRTNQKQNEGTRMLSEATVVPSRWKRESKAVTRRSCVLRSRAFRLDNLKGQNDSSLLLAVVRSSSYLAGPR